MKTQDKVEEIRINLAQLAREGEAYRGSGWGEEKMNRAFSFFDKFIDPDKHYRVLDLGCGGMTLTMYMREIPNFEIIGVDLVFELLSKLSRKRTPDVPLVNGDIEFLPFSSDSFDIVIHNQVLHHFRPRDLALAEIKRVLRHKGFMFSIETNGWNPYVYWWHYWPGSKKRNFVGDNEHPFGIFTFRKELKKASLNILDSNMINFDFVKGLGRMDLFFGKIPIFNIIFGGSMLVCSQKI